MSGDRIVKTDADVPTSDKWRDTCKNGHDKKETGWTALNGCRECKREASRRYLAARKAGAPLQENKRQARSDLGRDKVGE